MLGVWIIAHLRHACGMIFAFQSTAVPMQDPDAEHPVLRTAKIGSAALNAAIAACTEAARPANQPEAQTVL